MSSVCVACLPTGYGKTKAAAAAYVMFKERGLVNRFLHIVVRTIQSEQSGDDLPDEVEKLSGIRTNAFQVGLTPTAALRAHRNGSAEIFIVTVQSVGQSPKVIDVLAELMSTGQWFVWVDEHHHYSEDTEKKWAQWINKLPRCALFASSATPTPPDHTAPFGKPHVYVSYRDAFTEGAVKELELHAYDYSVELIYTGTGKITRLTTQEIFQAVGSESPVSIDEWMAAQNMQWSPRFIAPLIMQPALRMARRLGIEGVRSQMLVTAISCRHAKVVCEQIRSLLPEETTVDWIGTGPNGRTDTENKQILERFCPKKDKYGYRPWTLDVLVQVGMAGEGTDCVDVCEVTFLNSPKRNNTTLQGIGRGARVMKDVLGVKLAKQPITVINVDSSSDIAPFLGDSIMDIFESPNPLSETSKPKHDDRDFPDQPIDLNHVKFSDVSLINIRVHPETLKEVVEALEPKVRAVHAGSTEEWLQEEALKLAEAAIRKALQGDAEQRNQSHLIILQRSALASNTRTLAMEVMQILKRPYWSNKELFKPLIKRMTAQRNREIGSDAESASLEELARHQEWNSRFQQICRTSGVPAWLIC